MSCSCVNVKKSSLERRRGCEQTLDRCWLFRNHGYLADIILDWARCRSDMRWILYGAAERDCSTSDQKNPLFFCHPAKTTLFRAPFVLEVLHRCKDTGQSLTEVRLRPIKCLQPVLKCFHSLSYIVRTDYQIGGKKFLSAAFSQSQILNCLKNLTSLQKIVVVWVTTVIRLQQRLV